MDLNLHNHSYVIIPTPFKAGDIVKFADNQNNSLSGLETDVYVLEYIDYDSEGTMERRKQYGGDSSDMLGWGYSVDEESVVERAELFRYDQLEYYRGKLTGDQRILYFVSKYLKKEINLNHLLSMQSKILLQSASERISDVCSLISLVDEYDISMDKDCKVIGCRHKTKFLSNFFQKVCRGAGTESPQFSSYSRSIYFLFFYQSPRNLTGSLIYWFL